MDLLAAAADQRPPLEDVVHLVATGPDEVEGVPRATGVVVSDLFRGAEKSVIVVGYAVYQGQKVFRDLADRMVEHPGLKVRLYLDIQRKDGDTSMPEEVVRRFSEHFRSTQWPLQRPVPEIYYDTRSVGLERSKAGALHAKCVVVDAQRLFISSANFTEAAQVRNIEMGLLLDSAVLARRVTDFLERLIHRNLLKRLSLQS
jgi:phosphatidylserine/phosphatidylglycerophosphate/cardiolipin synthase-like enzyme